MAKKKKRVRTKKLEYLHDVKLPNFEEFRKIMEESRKEREKEKRRENRNSYRAFIQSGVKAGLPLKAVLWVMKNFEQKGRFDGNRRIGG